MFTVKHPIELLCAILILLFIEFFILRYIGFPVIVRFTSFSGVVQNMVSYFFHVSSCPFKFLCLSVRVWSWDV